jgi:HEPN domain-containing protein
MDNNDFVISKVKLLQQAKEMEKQQIIDAYIEASPRLEDITKESAEQYYNETFKKE